MSDLATLQADLAKYVAARDAILTGGQSYTVDGVQFSRGTLFRLEDKIDQLRADIAVMQNGGIRRLRSRGGRL